MHMATKCKKCIKLTSSPGHSIAMEKNREKAWDHCYVTGQKWWTRFVLTQKWWTGLVQTESTISGPWRSNDLRPPPDFFPWLRVSWIYNLPLLDHWGWWRVPGNYCHHTQDETFESIRQHYCLWVYRVPSVNTPLGVDNQNIVTLLGPPVYTETCTNIRCLGFSPYLDSINFTL